MLKHEVTRLAELKGLSDGWLDGAGVRPTAEALAAAEIFLSARPGACAIFPMPCGGIQVETKRGGWDIEVNLEANGGCTLSAICLKGDGETGPDKFAGLSEDFFLAFDRLAVGES